MSPAGGGAVDLDLAVIGAGPAGLAAATRARQLGLKDVVVFERDGRPGGILMQCIHPGFGLMRYGQELTGPEYAGRVIQEAQGEGVRIECDAMVIEADGERALSVVSPSAGLRRYRCRAVVLAMGCRERTRAAVRIPGARPAGIFTAGRAQRLLNVEGCLPGTRVLIVGSGDIGMIMARRLTLEGARVEAVVEINPYTSGLVRNEVQCLHDFGIPLLLGHELTEIRGEGRVEEVTVAARDAQGRRVAGSERTIGCDTVLLSVGLIPENELSRQAGVPIDAATGGPLVDNLLQTHREGFFACGNALHVSDLADDVSAEGELAAEGVAALLGRRLPPRSSPLALARGANIAQVVPQRIDFLRDTRVCLRVSRPTGPAVLRVGSLLRRRLPLCRPGEMIGVELPAVRIGALAPLAGAGASVEVRVERL